ncbi:MAG: bifunctional UDP-N-acetylglucosamine diphosphorylase/glucosamine-1-phosphate N-acetyltransferase GlmU, partial [Pseudolabrys sp.]|nr:bifunctional UDP-N-acetylglucosamine diphosphorylase/glucosamine-1-phosphate N-acetyltransferase GlmU [Pseudolabrys sp.]
NAEALKPTRIVGVVAPGATAVAGAFAPHPTVVQSKPLGTGHAAKAALGALKGHAGPVLVMFGDAPLVTTETLKRLVMACAREKAAVGVLGFVAEDPTPYGRLIVRRGVLERIVESKDADETERAVDFCNSGVMCLDGRLVGALLGAIKNDNAKREFYLTDAVAIAREMGLTAAVVEAEEDDVRGINTKAQLAETEAVLQRRLRQAAMDAGVTMIAPETVYLAADTQLGTDVVIEPHVVFGPGVVVEDGAVIHSFSHIAGARIGKGVSVGPFARLRPGTELGEGSRIGNFVEVKAAVFEAGAKANHLTYIGDARVGAGANVGAGTITCNYDGTSKYKTNIGKGAFIGSNSALVAPVSIGDGAYVGSGSVITKDVPADALAIGRGQQVVKEGGAQRLRDLAALKKKT